jgi:hypothetical protein
LTGSMIASLESDLLLTAELGEAAALLDAASRWSGFTSRVSMPDSQTQDAVLCASYVCVCSSARYTQAAAVIDGALLSSNSCACQSCSVNYDSSAVIDRD